MDNWSMIKEFYKETFGFPEGLVELASVKDILLMCVSGSSNETIAKFFDEDIKYIDKIIKDWLWFEGWDADLNFSPYQVYNLRAIHQTYGISIFKSDLEKFANDEFIKKYKQASYRICQYYRKYEDMINEQWR